MKHKLTFFSLVGAYLISRILVLKSAGSYWFDEAFSVHFASLPYAEMLSFLKFEHNPLVHYTFLHTWLNVFGNSEVIARSLSLIAGLLALFMIYLLAKLLFSKKVGLWAMFFFILSTLHLYHQTEARMYALVGLFTLTTLYCFWRWFKSPGGKGVLGWKSSRSKRTGWLVLYALSAALLVHTHMTAWAFLVGLWVFWAIEVIDAGGLAKFKTKKVLAWLAVNALVLLSFLIWFIPVFLNKQLAGNISQGWFFFQTSEGFWFSHLTNFLLQGQDGMIVRAATSLVIVILLFFAFFRLEKPGWWQQVISLFDRTHWPVTVTGQWTPQLRLLLFTFLTPLLIGFALQITISKYLLSSSLMLFILLAVGIDRLKQKQTHAVLVFFLLVLMLPTQAMLAINKRHHLDEVGQVLERIAGEKPVVVHSFINVLPLQRYVEGVELIPFYPRQDDLTFEERVVRYNWQAIVNRDNVSVLSQALEGHEKFVLVSSTAYEHEEDVLKEWLWRNGWQIEKIHRWPGYGNPEILEFSK